MLLQSLVLDGESDVLSFCSTDCSGRCVATGICLYILPGVSTQRPDAPEESQPVVVGQPNGFYCMTMVILTFASTIYGPFHTAYVTASCTLLTSTC